MADTMFPHTVTVYNTMHLRNPVNVTQEITVNYITFLRGVLLSATKASNVRASGLEGADAVDLYIPFDVEATDPEGNPKTFIEPVVFWNRVAAGEDVSKNWTLSTNQNTWFVKDAVLPPEGISDDNVYASVNMAHESWYVTKVDEMDYGGLPHWEVGGA